MVNVASTRQIARARQRSKDDLEAEQYTICNIMRLPSGRRWMWLLLERARIFVGTENLDPQIMAFEKGERNFGLMLFNAVLRHAPTEYIRMTNENSSANLQEEETQDGGNTDSSFDA